MNTVKKILLILTPLAIIAIIWIIFNAIKLITIASDDITYTNTAIQGQVMGRESVTNVFDTDAYSDIPRPSGETFLNNWQDSNKIRKDIYKPIITQETTTSNSTSSVIKPTEDIKDTTNIDTTYQAPSAESSDIWAWVPQTILREQKEVTDQTSPEKIYINNYGTKIKKVVKTLGNQPEIMSRFISGRGEVGNKTELLTMAKKYEALGEELLHITANTTATEGIKRQGYELGNAYISVGKATKWLAEQETTNDAEMIEEIYAYNEQIDHFAKEFVSFANLIGAYGIKFEQGEGGDIFTPPGLSNGTL